MEKPVAHSVPDVVSRTLAFHWYPMLVVANDMSRRETFPSRSAITGGVLEVGAGAIMFSVDYPYESSRG